MTPDQERIRLAEAMGYETIRRGVDFWEGIAPTGDHTWRLPDPFTDANDDYAVLEWARSDERRMQFPAFVGALSDVMDIRLQPGHSANYQIGDYARAALKVLEKDDG